jgi:G:T-mismatch repair DNA endonuclease (very short patch repair protein)
LPLVSLTCEYLRKFSKKFQMTLMLFSGAWWKTHEKTKSKKSRDIVPLSVKKLFFSICLIYHHRDCKNLSVPADE